MPESHAKSVLALAKPSLPTKAAVENVISFAKTSQAAIKRIETAVRFAKVELDATRNHEKATRVKRKARSPPETILELEGSLQKSR